MSEKLLVNKIMKYLESVGAKAVKFHGNRFVQAGTPDILGCYKGFSFVIECKVGKNKTTKKQDHQLKEWAAANSYTVIAYSLESVKEMIKELESLRKYCYENRD